MAARLAAICGLAAATAVGSAGPVAAAEVARAAAPAGPVLPTPAASTPHLPATTSTVEQIRQIVRCGRRMYAVGTFTTIVRRSRTYTRHNIFSFSATAPYTVTSWDPKVNGTVNSITFHGANCADAYIGGRFTAVGATTVKNIAEISTTTGHVVPTFGHNASGQVETLVSYRNHIIAGGFFTGINGSSADPFLASLNPVTGRNDGFVQLNISGNYSYPGVSVNTTHVYNQALSHSRSLDLVMGDFTSVGGLPRQQIFMLDLSATPASVTGWTSPQWDGSQGEATPQDPTNGYPYECSGQEAFYIRAAAWSPDDSIVYLATTGFHPAHWPTGIYPINGLCDAAAAFPATQAQVLAKWINYAGCDSLFSAASDSRAAYFAGHERWSENSNGCNRHGPGGIWAPGIEGLHPRNPATATCCSTRME